jgi:predicted ATPase
MPFDDEEWDPGRWWWWKDESSTVGVDAADLAEVVEPVRHGRKERLQFIGTSTNVRIEGARRLRATTKPASQGSFRFVTEQSPRLSPQRRTRK